MTIESAVYARLNAAAIAIPPTLNTTQIYPIIAPQDTDPPYVIFEITDGIHHRDVTFGRVRLVNSHVDITCYARTYKAMKTLAAQVRLIMEPAGADFRVGDIYDSQDAYDADTKLYFQTIVISTWHSEVPT